MSEFVYDRDYQPAIKPIEELRQVIDEIIDGNPGEVLTPELQGKFAEAVAHVAAKYGKSPDEMTQLVETIIREEG